MWTGAPLPGCENQDSALEFFHFFGQPVFHDIMGAADFMFCASASFLDPRDNDHTCITGVMQV